MTLRLVGFDLVEMDRGTWMWIQLTHFAIETVHDDRTLLASLIAHQGYVHDYASPFDAEKLITEPAVHGRWWRSTIHAEMFEPQTAADAESLLQEWADDQEWIAPNYRQPPVVQRRLREVYALLRSGDLYMLRHPGAADEHEYGWVTGSMGFHEFVVIDRGTQILHVVVASDD